MTEPWLAGLLLTALVGVSIGLFSAGGSIIMLPVLVYVVGVEPHAAVPLSLLIVGTTSLAGVALRSREGALDWRAALPFGGAALAGAFAGSRLTHLVPGAVLLLCFGVLLIVVGLNMWREPHADSTSSTSPARLPLLLATGALVGIATGFLGVGGGFLIVPALMRIGRLALNPAMKASLIVITMSSAAGLVAHGLQGRTVSIELAAPLTAAALAGMWLGIWGAHRVSGGSLRRGFAAFVAIVGVALVIVNTPFVVRMLT